MMLYLNIEVDLLVYSACLCMALARAQYGTGMATKDFYSLFNIASRVSDNLTQILLICCLVGRHLACKECFCLQHGHITTAAIIIF